MSRRIALLLTLTLLAAAVTGCTNPSPKPTQSAEQATDAHVAPEQTVQPVAGLSDMPADQKTSELNSEFVTEWPVVSGTVLSAEAATANELKFVVAANAPATAVEEWYRSVAAGRAFVLNDESRADDGTVTLKFYRAGLSYVVEITPTGASTARVQGTLTFGQ